MKKHRPLSGRHSGPQLRYQVLQNEPVDVFRVDLLCEDLLHVILIDHDLFLLHIRDVEGNIWSHDYTISKKGQIIATIHKKWLSWSDTYEMNIYQRDLTNIMAHDLKSPLMVIRGSAENLQDNESNEYTQTIINEADYMSTLISRILSLSKLESNQEKMKSEEVNFKEILEKIIEKYSEETDRRNIKVAVKESDNILKVKGDSFWISEALSNLFDNAVKYSPDDSDIKIELNNKSISIRNKMSDPDINEKELEKLKKSFMRGDNSRSGQSGNGLGLTIAENILTRNHLNLTLKKDGDDFIATIIC